MAGKDNTQGRAGNGKGQWAAFLSLAAALVLTGLAVVNSTHESRHLLNQLQELEKRRNALQVEWGQLLLEQSSMVSQGRIEQIAIAELGMEVPAMDQVVVVREQAGKAAGMDMADEGGKAR